MSKKVLSLVTLVAFMLFDWACLSIKNVPVTSVTSKDQIVGVTKITGEYVQIPKENPARIVENQIVLRPSNAISLSDIKDFKQDNKGVVYEITTKYGSTIRDIEGQKQVWKIVFPSPKYKPAPIPLSEVNFVSVRRTDVVLTILLVVGIIGGVIGGIYLIYLNAMSHILGG
jgi:hypothetical protein